MHDLGRVVEHAGKIMFTMEAVMLKICHCLKLFHPADLERKFKADWRTGGAHGAETCGARLRILLPGISCMSGPLST
jgi:hypothetical protein